MRAEFAVCPKKPSLKREAEVKILATSNQGALADGEVALIST